MNQKILEVGTQVSDIDLEDSNQLACKEMKLRSKLSETQTQVKLIYDDPKFLQKEYMEIKHEKFVSSQRSKFSFSNSTEDWQSKNMRL